MSQMQQTTIVNSQEIIKIKDTNTELRRVNAGLCGDVSKLINDIVILKGQVESLEQYSRINNLEIVGIDDPDDKEKVEEVILDCLNGLTPDISEDKKIVAADIDICHILPKKNNEHSHVVRFISRKVKLGVLNVKRQQQNKLYKYKEKSIYINDHLTTKNKYLFALAKQKQRSANYKHLWTKGGRVFMRKEDNSQVITIDSEETISYL